jgi:transposase-like protein
MSRDKRQAKMEERRAHWREIVEAAARSGQSIRGFCRERKVGEHLFYHWRRVLELEGRAGKRDEARFVLVRPEAEASTETAAGLAHPFFAHPSTQPSSPVRVQSGLV